MRTVSATDRESGRTQRQVVDRRRSGPGLSCARPALCYAAALRPSGMSRNDYSRTSSARSSNTSADPHQPYGGRPGSSSSPPHGSVARDGSRGQAPHRMRLTSPGQYLVGPSFRARTTMEASARLTPGRLLNELVVAERDLGADRSATPANPTLASAAPRRRFRPSLSAAPSAAVSTPLTGCVTAPHS